MDEEVTVSFEPNPKLIPVVVGLLAFGAGIGIGYILGKRRSTEVITLSEYSPEFRPPKVIVSEDEIHEEPKLRLNLMADDEDIIEVSVNDTAIEVETSNIFAAVADDEWDYNKEVDRRRDTEPYIIHRDEFFSEDDDTADYIQKTLTYYEGDDVLVDDESPEQPIYNHSSVVGPLKFGHGSGDPNVVYVRNMTRHTEYEIIRDPGMHSVEVLGLQNEKEAREKELKHSKERKFRAE